MSETMPLALGERSFDVPRLPLGVTLTVYPICRRLSRAGVAERIIADEDITDEERGDLVEIACHLAHAMDETIDAKAFLALPVTPPQLNAAFFIARIQCGGWTRLEDGDGQGEGRGPLTAPP